MTRSRGVCRAFLVLAAAAAAGCTGSAPGPPEACGVRGSPTSSDSALARQACEWAAARFEELFGERPPPGEIVLSDDLRGLGSRVEDGRWTFSWPRTAHFRDVATALGYGGGIDAFVDEEWRSTLPHELGHVVLGAWAYPDGEPAVGNRYGTPMPDWFDEAVAVWMESDDARAERVRQFREMLPRPRLDELLRPDHPSVGRPVQHGAVLTLARSETREACKGECPGFVAGTTTIRASIDARGVVTVDTIWTPPGAAPPGLDSQQTAFYPLSYAVLQFLHELGGAEAVRALAGRLKADPARADALAGLPGLPADPDSLEALWQKWLAEG